MATSQAMSSIATAATFVRLGQQEVVLSKVEGIFLISLDADALFFQAEDPIK